MCFLISFKICNYVGFIMFFGRRKGFYVVTFFEHLEITMLQTYTCSRISFWNRFCSITNSAVIDFTYPELIFCPKYTQSTVLFFSPQLMVTPSWLMNKQTTVNPEITLNYSLPSCPTCNLLGNSCDYFFKQKHPLMTSHFFQFLL